MPTAKILPLFSTALIAAGSPTPAAAVTLSLQSESSPAPGVTLRRYRTSSPSTNTFALLVDLCHNNVHIGATAAPSSLRTTGSWADSLGAQVAVNGDFYKTGPVRVYGNAAGGGVPWPLEQTGAGSGTSWEWFYESYGWIAVGPDWIDFSHSGWVKANREVSTGWSPSTFTHLIPDDTMALVSGFPELVVEGAKVTCSSPTASSCFPDRSDMRARHPRTAAGLTQDRRTLILVVVDGRTATSAGMYGTELADVMDQLDAWVAFNLDGGGSSQMWSAASGYVNDAGGNNGGGFRAVANHWGVFSNAGSPRSRRPGHCVDLAAVPCQTITPAGGTVDESGDCFDLFGPLAYWRQVPGAGNGGSLLWTNAWQSPAPSNWARWQLHFTEAGRYRVEVRVVPEYGLWSATPYTVTTAWAEHEVTLDQSSASGWATLGTFDFDAGGGQHVSVHDNSATPVASGQHISVDAVRLTRIHLCNDGACTGTEDCASCPTDCGACPPVCGDGSCQGDEDCASCLSDCGACPPQCGDTRCDGDEDCISCATDCGDCPSVCGDGVCDDDEGCAFCADDCGDCPPTCGDGACDDDEDCAFCADDCGACPPNCGDGECGDDEGCRSCPEDCGTCNPSLDPTGEDLTPLDPAHSDAAPVALIGSCAATLAAGPGPLLLVLLAARTRRRNLRCRFDCRVSN